jgi:ethanolamine ammonia-lyase small subunit
MTADASTPAPAPAVPPALPIAADPAPASVAMDAPAFVRPDLAAATPARVFLGRVGTTLRTEDLLTLRADHAAAKDAVRARLDDEAAALEPLAAAYGMFTVASRAATPQAYLRRPDLGRLLDDEGAALVAAEGTWESTVQLVVADGLSARAVGSYAPAFVTSFAGWAAESGWTLGRLIAIRHARVGLMNEIGELLRPDVVLMLIGERPGLDVQSGMSAYVGYRPDRTHTDANRSLISNIHDDGLAPEQAAKDAAVLVAQILKARASGVSAQLAAHEQRKLQ